MKGKYSAGDRLPTDGQLVRQFKASRPTVARAMRDLEKEGYLERRAGSGSFVRMPAQAEPSLIGLLIPEVEDAEIFGPICSEISVQCQKYNLSLLWSDPSKTAHPDMEMDARSLCNRYIRLNVAGVFFAPVEFSQQMVEVNREIAERLDDAGISVVLLDRDLERAPKRSRFDLVSVDNFRLGALQTEHMINVGAKKIGYVSRDFSAPTIDLRIAGYRHAMAHHNITPKEDLVFSGSMEDNSFLKQILSAKPDALVCSNDKTAVMLLRELANAGLSVPDDIKLIGVDDVNSAKLSPVALTTISQKCRDIGSAAVQTMIKRIENRKKAAHDVLVDFQLTVRDSCGANQMST